MTMQIASTAAVKDPADMTDSELAVTLSDVSEVIQWLTRDDASYEERCFSEEVKKKARVFSDEIARRQAAADDRL